MATGSATFAKVSPGAHVANGRLFFRLLDGSTVLCTCITEPYASQIVAACRGSGETAEVWRDSAARIEDYDRRQAAGEDVSAEVRPRLPGGSDW